MEFLKKLGYEETRIGDPHFIRCDKNNGSLSIIKSYNTKYFNSEKEVIQFIIDSLKENDKLIEFGDFKPGNERSLYTHFLKASNTIACDTRRGAGNNAILTGVYYNMLSSIEQFLPIDKQNFTCGRFCGSLIQSPKEDFSLISYVGPKNTDCGLKFLQVNTNEFQIRFNDNWQDYYNVIITDKNLIKYRWMTYMQEKLYV